MTIETGTVFIKVLQILKQVYGYSKPSYIVYNANSELQRHFKGTKYIISLIRSYTIFDNELGGAGGQL